MPRAVISSSCDLKMDNERCFVIEPRSFFLAGKTFLSADLVRLKPFLLLSTSRSMIFQKNIW